MAVKVPPLLHKMSASAQKAWYKKHGMEMPDDAGGKSAAAAKKVKVAPRKTIAVEPGSVRALNAARQKEYMAKGGRQPIGAMGSGGSNVMAGSGQSTIKDLKASIKAGFNPKVSLDPYASEKAKKVGPRTLKLKEESIDEALSPERKRMFDLKLKLIKKAANRKDRAKPSKVIEPRTSLNPAVDMKLNPKPMDTRTWDYIMKNEEASPMIKPPTNRFDKKSDAFAHVEKHGGKVYKQTYTDSKGQQTVSYSVKKEEVELDEVTKKEAESVLGGAVKEKPKMAPGNQPAGYRYVRGLARKAMKAGMKKEEVEVVEAVKDVADVGEYDYEGDMAKSQLRSILANAKRMHDMLDENTNLPEWVQSKITLAEDYIVTAANYMEGEMNEGYGGKFPKEWQKEMEKIPSTSTVVHKDKTVVTTKKDGKVVDVRTTKNEEVEQIDEGDLSIRTLYNKWADHYTSSEGNSAKRADAVEKTITKVHGHEVMNHLKKAIKANLRNDMDQEENHFERARNAAEKSGSDRVNATVGKDRSKFRNEEVALDEADLKSKPVLHKGKEIGETGIDAEASPGVGKWYAKHHKSGMNTAGFDSRKEAESEVRAAHGLDEEAEGSAPTTPKEKELAKHHGDPNKITYGDVIKARLKSAAAKKMGK